MKTILLTERWSARFCRAGRRKPKSPKATTAHHLAEAEPYYRQALTVYEIRLGPNRPNTERARAALAALQAQLEGG